MKNNNSAPNIRRLLSCLIDWYICSVLISASTVILESFSLDILQLSVLIAIFAIIITFIYYVGISYLLGGQTIGKKLLNLKIVKTDNSKLSFKTLFFREILGTFIIEGSIMAGSNYFRELLQICTSFNILIPLSIISSIITIFSIIVSQFNKDKRLLHDYIANTKVIITNI